MSERFPGAVHRLGIAVALTAAAMLLAGCSAEAREPQAVSVTYAEPGAETVTVTVDVPALRCTSLGDARMFDVESEDDPAPVTGVVNEAVGTHTLLLQLDETLWFSSNNPYTVGEDGFEFDQLSGMVSLMGDDGIVTDAIDLDAVLDGSVECSGA